MVVARKIAYNVAVSSVSKVLSTALALVSIAFITRYLGKEGFGNYATVLAFLSFFAAIADLGLYSISTREISKEGANEQQIMGNIFSLRIVSAGVVLVLVPLITWFLPYPTPVKQGIFIAALSFLFSSSYQVLNGIFQKNLAMDKVAVAELTGKLFQVGFIILAINKGLGFTWIVAALLLNMVVSFAIVYGWSKKYLNFRLHFDFAYWKSFLKESAPLGAAAIITFAYFKTDTILLSVLKNSGEVGIYNAANKVLENITFFPAMIVGLIFPLLTKEIFKNPARFQAIANKTFKVFLLMVLPLIVGVLFLADGIIQVIGGGGFAESAAVLRILVFALAFIFFGNFYNSILIAGNLQKKLMRILILAAVMNIALNLYFIPRFSYFSSAFISVLTELVVVVATATIAARQIKYRPRVEKIGSILAATGVMTIFLALFRDWNFFLVGLSSAAVYFAALWLLKAVKTEELLSLVSKKGVQEYENIP